MATYKIVSHLIEKFAKKMNAQSFAFSYNCDLEWRSRSNGYKTMQCTGTYHHNKFERNLLSEWRSTLSLLSERKSPKLRFLRCILMGQDKMSVKFTMPTTLNSRPNTIQTNWKLGEILGAECFAFLLPCDLESRSLSLSLVSECRFHQYQSSSQIWA